ncbi:hypothetical protein B0H13DRAFT_1889504 [Mycena leptocephala]|nr:hypothetical protein B0H13DRAFT_1889504 [Mycena leptocephala]
MDQHNGSIFHLVNEDLHGKHPSSEQEESNFTSSSAPTELAKPGLCSSVVGERTLGCWWREGRKRGRSWSMREWWDQDAKRRRTGAGTTDGRCVRSREKRGTNVRRRHRRRRAVAHNADLDVGGTVLLDSLSKDRATDAQRGVREVRGCNGSPILYQSFDVGAGNKAWREKDRDGRCWIRLTAAKG